MRPNDFRETQAENPDRLLYAVCRSALRHAPFALLLEGLSRLKRDTIGHSQIPSPLTPDCLLLNRIAINVPMPLQS